MKSVLDQTLRGFGQMLVANNRVTGLCVLIGLFCLSISSALLSLGGALLISVLARLRARGDDTVLKTGLFSVNGALLGASWIVFPQVPAWVQIVATSLGCVLMAWYFVPILQRMRVNKSPFVLFSLPGVAATWLALVVLMVFGVHDPELTRGWRALLTDRFEEAEKHFLNTKVSTDMAEAWRCAGLGWSLNRRGDQTGAQTAFSRVLSLQTGVADAYDGLGWSRFRQERYDEAALAFRRAVALDSFFAGSWNGLGWCALRQNKPEEARSHFATSALCAPLFADAFSGLAQTLPEGRARSITESWSALLTSNLGRSTRFLSVRMLLCSACCFAGVLWHSRMSALTALTALVFCMTGSIWVPAFSDPALVLNVVAIFLSLGGHYLRLNTRTFGWMLVISILISLLHAPVNEALLCLGLLPLSLPFNLALLSSLAVLRRDRVPIDWAASTPGQISVFLAQKEVAEVSWKEWQQAAPASLHG